MKIKNHGKSIATAVGTQIALINVFSETFLS